jgi:1,4-alpha-glucan branching enzyme
MFQRAGSNIQQPIFVFALILSVRLGLAQNNEPAAGDWKPATSNQSGKEYPQLNSERRARFRIVAPQAQSVTVSLDKLPLTKGEDGAWVGMTKPLDEGFHYYMLNIDGAEVPDPNSNFFFGYGRWGQSHRRG